MTQVAKNPYEVRGITYDETKPFLLGVHYARRMPCIQYAFGLYEDGDLIGVCTFGQPASPFLCKGVAGETNRLSVLELNRLCFLPGKNGNNRASVLVSQSLKLLPPNLFIVSYADGEGWGHIGYVYQATNWIYTGMTKSCTDKCGTSGGHPRHYDRDTDKRQYRTAKHRYVYITGGAKSRKKLIKELKYPIKPYPKGETHRYDTSSPKPIKDLEL